MSTFAYFLDPLLHCWQGNSQLHPTNASIATKAAPQSKKDEGEAFSFHHLWFLWHLCWLVVGFGLIALLTRRFPLPKLPD